MGFFATCPGASFLSKIQGFHRAPKSIEQQSTIFQTPLPASPPSASSGFTPSAALFPRTDPCRRPVWVHPGRFHLRQLHLGRLHLGGLRDRRWRLYARSLSASTSVSPNVWPQIISLSPEASGGRKWCVAFLMRCNCERSILPSHLSKYAAILLQKKSGNLFKTDLHSSLPSLPGFACDRGLRGHRRGEVGQRVRWLLPGGVIWLFWRRGGLQSQRPRFAVVL